MGFKMKPKSPLTKKLVGGQHRLPAELKQEILNSPAKNYKNPQDYKVFNMGNEPTPVKKYKSDAQRKAVHASKADGGKGAPTKKKENFGTGDKKTERKLNRINRKMQKQHAKQDRNEDKGTKRGDRRADKAHAKGRKLLAKGRAIKKAADERTANLKEVGPPKESPAKMKDLSGDGKITKKDVLIGRGVLKKDSPAKMKMKKPRKDMDPGFTIDSRGNKAIPLPSPSPKKPKPPKKKGTMDARNAAREKKLPKRK